MSRTTSQTKLKRYIEMLERRAAKEEATERLRKAGIEEAPPRRKLGEKAARKALEEMAESAADEDVDELFSLE